MTEEHKKDYIDRCKRMYIMDGLAKELKLSVEELPRKTMLGSTDRKGYTLKISASYFDDICEAFVEIQPFYSEEETKDIIEQQKVNSKHIFAGKLYDKYFK